MDFDELKERYRGLPIWARLLIALGIGLVPAGYVYYNEGEALTTELDEARTERDRAQVKLDRSIEKKKKIPEVEERLAELEEQLSKAKKVLPDSFRVEEVLQKAAVIAKETGVALNLFNPEEEKPGAGDYKYMELPISTEIEGRFNQIATFFDRLLHLEQSLFVRAIDIGSILPDGEAANEDLTKSPHRIALETRQKLQAKAKFHIVVYRSMTEREIADAEAAAGPAEEGRDARQRGASDDG